MWQEMLFYNSCRKNAIVQRANIKCDIKENLYQNIQVTNQVFEDDYLSCIQVCH